jgi:hypothetical protein
MTKFIFRTNPNSYLLWFLALIGLAMITPPILVKTHLFNRMSKGTVIEANMDYPFELTAESFDIVVFGESTGRYDIDPRIVSSKLRLKTINLSEDLPFLQLVGEFGLDHYLSTNQKPKLLVLAISPSNVSLPPLRPEISGFEGWYSLIRHGNTENAFTLLLRDPISLFNFWSVAIYQTLPLARPGGAYSVLHDQVVDGKGYVPYPLLVPLASCPAAPLEQKELVKQHSYVDYFVRKYELRGLKVAVFLTPVPDCNPNLRVFKNSLLGVASNEPYGISRDLFAADEYAAHALPRAVPRISEDLVAAIKPLLLAGEPLAAVEKIRTREGPP